MAKEKLVGIYLITNNINNKGYIGQSTDLKNREYSHLSYLRRNKHNNKHLQYSWNKYGEENFEFIIVEYCNIDIIDTRECYWIDYFDFTDITLGYNIESGGCLNKEVSEYTREKLRDINSYMPVIQLDLKGNHIKEWRGARESSKMLNINQSCIWQCLNKIRKTYKNSIWIYKSEYENKDFVLDLDFYTFNRGQAIEIVQLNKQGEIIKIWNSANEIQRETNKFFDCSSIIKVCKHKYFESKGFVFLYNKGDTQCEFINHINICNSSHKKQYKLAQ